jgi:DNA-binding transcriptional LysR family regulator
MYIPWEAIQLFLAVAEGGSLSEAAKILQVTQPTVSRRLADLETTLGEALFVRTVAGTTLTSFGERWMEPAQRMAEQAGELERVAAGAESEPRGNVRVSAPPGIAFELVAPFAQRVREVYPEVRLEVISSVSYVDLVRREADLAIRAQLPTQRDLVCLASLKESISACASPSYIASLPNCYQLSDVGFIGWPPSLAHLPPNPQLAALLPGFRPVFTADDFLIQLRAAEAGVGAIVLSQKTSRYAMPSNLVVLELDFGRIKTAMHLVCARSALGVPRIKAVADLLGKELHEETRRPRQVSIAQLAKENNALYKFRPNQSAGGLGKNHSGSHRNISGHFDRRSGTIAYGHGVIVPKLPKEIVPPATNIAIDK